MNQTKIQKRQSFHNFCQSQSKNKASNSEKENISQDQTQQAKIYYSYFLQFNYQYLKEIGRGGFGTVLKAMEIKRNEKVAVKIIYQTTNSCSICSELTFLKILQNNQSFTQAIDSFIHQSSIHIVFQHFKHNKFIEIVQQKNLQVVKNYMKQLIQCLAELKKHGIIHRDIKHLNFLYNIKEQKGVLIDFGAAEISWEYIMQNENLDQEYKTLNQINNGLYRNKIGTEQFMPLESLMRVQNQSYEVDIWGAGVIFFQLLSQKQGFFVKQNFTHHKTRKYGYIISFIIQISQLFGEQKVKDYMEQLGIEFNNTLKLNEQINLNAYFNNIWSYDSEVSKAVNLIEQMLEIDPTKRISVEKAIEHPFLK